MFERHKFGNDISAIQPVDKNFALDDVDDEVQLPGHDNYFMSLDDRKESQQNDMLSLRNNVGDTHEKPQRTSNNDRGSNEKVGQL